MPVLGPNTLNKQNRLIRRRGGRGGRGVTRPHICHPLPGKGVSRSGMDKRNAARQIANRSIKQPHPAPENRSRVSKRIKSHQRVSKGRRTHHRITKAKAMARTRQDIQPGSRRHPAVTSPPKCQRRLRRSMKGHTRFLAATHQQGQQ